MPKLIINMDPVSPATVYEITDNNGSNKIFQANQPVNIIKFLANYIKDTDKSTEVLFVGPDDYINPWITEANQFDFVKARNAKGGKF